MNFLHIPVQNWLLFFGMNAVVLVASYVVSSRILRPVQHHDRGFVNAMIVAGLVYLAFILVLVLFFGVVVQTLNAWWIGGAAVTISVGNLLLFWKERIPFFSSLFGFWQAIRASADIWTWLFLGLLLVQIVLLLVKVYIMPVHILDSMAYRVLPAPMWVQMDHIPNVLDAPANEVNGRTLSIAVLAVWYFIFFGSDHWVNGAQYIASLTLLLLVYAVGKQCGLSRGNSIKAATLFFFMPLILMESVTTQDHLAINMAFVASLYFMREAFIQRNWVYAPIIGLSIGLMFAFKNNAVVYLPILVIALIWMILQQRLTMKDCLSCVRMKSATVSVSAALAVIVGGYWTLRNLVVFHNPFGLLFAPGVNFREHIVDTIEETDEPHRQFLSEVSGQIVNTSDGVHAQVAHSSQSAMHLMTGLFKKSLENLQDNLAGFFSRVSDVGNFLYTPVLKNISGFGPQFFSFGMVALVFLILSVVLKRYRTSASFYAATGLLMLLVYFCVMSNIYAYRNFIFFPALLIPYFFTLLGDLNQPDRHTNPVLARVSPHFMQGTMFFCLLWSFYFTCMPANANPIILKEFVEIEPHYQSPARYLRQFNKFRPIMRRMDELPVESGLAYVNSHQRNSWSYAFYDVHWKRRVEYIPLLKKYFQCNSEDLTCLPEEAFKKRLIQDKIMFVNTCFFGGACPGIKDPEFVEIGKGLYYFRRISSAE
ncbi:MAG: hypothetical protein D6698_12575 [Gammaproteobacteria bacterium]|nr:MAG: hypothetical protein D6698_12575 [Gammaproteobacteria bacterium]